MNTRVNTNYDWTGGEIPARAIFVVRDPAAKIQQDPVAFARGLGFHPDARQAEVLRCGARRVLLNCTRQWGKSTVTALMAVHRMWSRPGSLVLATGPSERQTAEFVRKAREFVARLDVAPRGDGQNRRSILLPNGSRMVGVPSGEAKVRGFFWEEWTNGGPGWTRVSVPATECPRISKEFLEEERQKHTDDWFRPEYLCEFVQDWKGLFDMDLVDAAFTDDYELLDLGGPVKG